MGSPRMRRLRNTTIVFAAGLALLACSSDSASDASSSDTATGADATGGDTAAPADTSTSTDATAPDGVLTTTDTPSPPDATNPPDTGPATCDPGCGLRGSCVAGACVCDAGWMGDVCDSCAQGYAPAGALCAPAVPWNEGPYGSGITDRVEDFTVTTQAGPWRFQTQWSGLDSYLFIFKYGASAGGEQVWSQPIAELIARLPLNVHVFFGSYDASYVADVDLMSARVDVALSALPAEERSYWSGRLHMLATRGNNQVGGLAKFIASRGNLYFAIDRFQRWREVGSLYDFNTGANKMSFVANEAEWFEYEFRTQAEMTALGGDEIVLWDGDRHQGGWGGGYSTRVEVELPSADTLAGYDTAWFYLYAACPSHLQGKDNGCNEWDYIQQLHICDEALPAAVGAMEPTECQAHIPGVPEVLGTCAGTDTPCATADACEPGVACEGYVEAIAATPADTWPCACRTPEGDTMAAERQCNAEGTGFGECGCGCERELVRWVTPYGREGAWLTDITPLLALIKDGGTRTFRFAGANGYDVHAKILLANKGRGMRPVKARYLWGRPGGTSFNPAYNDGQHEDALFDVPEGTTKVELVTVISGHGHSSTAENCAEFCNHEHHFSLNGQPAQILDHPIAGTPYGCMDQTLDGGVPNQFGTWVYGRGGWCAGMDVEPWTLNLTAGAKPTGNVLSYRGLYRGMNYTPTVTSDGYQPEIKMASWLVFYEAMDTP